MLSLLNLTILQCMVKSVIRKYEDGSEGSECGLLILTPFSLACGY